MVAFLGMVPFVIDTAKPAYPYLFADASIYATAATLVPSSSVTVGAL
uniref:Uncharacterized protein n=1 Tax=Manihot esculenta TaxID=3983 RepID=A0A2C9V687_MANES